MFKFELGIQRTENCQLQLEIDIVMQHDL